MPKISEYERKRQETIAKNKALLRSLALDAAATGLAPKPSPAAAAKKSVVKRKPAAPKIKEEVVPRRTSSRLRGLAADSEGAKRKAEEELQARETAATAKRQRVGRNLGVDDMLVSGKGWDTGGVLAGLGPARAYERTFDETDVKETTDKELKALREKMSGLELWKGIEPNRIKVTPERTYSMAFHPTADKALVFCGDKEGNLGIFDTSQSKVKSEVKVEDDDEGYDDDSFEPAITTLKLHTRTISSLAFPTADPSFLYSSSYDSSIRKFDLAKGVAVEVYAPKDNSDDPISELHLTDAPHMLYFSTLNGQVGQHDTRTKPFNTTGSELWQLSEKKIGGFSLHPRHPHLLATASLDRTMRLWDLRKITGKRGERLPALLGEHESRLSVSHASFNGAGQVATSSYDNTVKIYDFGGCADWAPGQELDAARMEPTVIVQHNNQTGRWVTILRAQWQAHPTDGVQRFAIGNMNRFVDIFTSTGKQLAQLGGDGISAVPAVARFHPSLDWVAGATASGKLCLWM
ncbi:WD40 repeat-like protein [Trichodelitschia bisporula]|uniref:DNA damage-binding protein CMR1 n=1 Tax=Trichodelitschia bisporula TaxID=703511 RepID=A0A6G1I2K7_9PEZI|nr:WD40 repeat-like protein [Trichodelitschia bisporula]